MRRRGERQQHYIVGKLGLCPVPRVYAAKNLVQQ